MIASKSQSIYCFHSISISSLRSNALKEEHQRKIINESWIFHNDIWNLAVFNCFLWMFGMCFSTFHRKMRQKEEIIAKYFIFSKSNIKFVKLSQRIPNIILNIWRFFVSKLIANVNTFKLTCYTLPSIVSLVPTHPITKWIRPRRSVWSQPHKLGTLSSHRLWTFMSHAVHWWSGWMLYLRLFVCFLCVFFHFSRERNEQ